MRSAWFISSCFRRPPDASTRLPVCAGTPCNSWDGRSCPLPTPNYRGARTSHTENGYPGSSATSGNCTGTSSPPEPSCPSCVSLTFPRPHLQQFADRIDLCALADAPLVERPSAHLNRQGIAAGEVLH